MSNGRRLKPEPRVLLVGNLPRPNVITGLRVAFSMLHRGLMEAGVACDVIDRSSAEEQRVWGTLTFHAVFHAMRSLVEFAVRLPRSDVIYIALASTRGGFFRDATMIWMAKVMRRRSVVHAHGGGFRIFYENLSSTGKLLVRITLARTERIVALSERLRHQFDFMPDWHRRTVAVPYGLPPSEAPDEGSVKTLDPDAPLRIIYLSNLIPSKGYRELFDACRLLAEDGEVDFMCDYFGGFHLTAEESAHDVDQVRRAFTGEIDRSGLADRVQYHGVVRGGDKLDALSRAHLFVLPTTYAWEGQPISIIEAMASGIPVIATDHRGIKDMVKDGFNGVIVEQDAEQIASAIRNVWSDHDRYRRLSRNARQTYLEEFTYETHIERLHQVLLGEDRPRAVAAPTIDDESAANNDE